MLYAIVKLVVETVGGLFGAAMLLRAYMQWVRLGGRNPVSAVVFALTDRFVLPLRRMLPGRGGIDWASLVGAFFVALFASLVLELVFAVAIGAPAVPQPLVVLAFAVVMLLRWALYTVMLLAIVWVVLSWVNPYAPFAPAIGVLIEPLLAPFRRVLPRLGGLDLSPLALVLVVQIALLLLGGAARSIPGLA